MAIVALVYRQRRARLPEMMCSSCIRAAIESQTTRRATVNRTLAAVIKVEPVRTLDRALRVAVGASAV